MTHDDHNQSTSGAALEENEGEDTLHDKTRIGPESEDTNKQNKRFFSTLIVSHFTLSYSDVLKCLFTLPSKQENDISLG